MSISVRKGFTLIELLVVISIIGVLSSTVAASLSTARMKARDSKRISDLRTISIALSMYADQNGRYPQANTCAYDVSYCYISSYSSTGWNALQTSLLPYLAKLPVDSINTPCVPWTLATNCYSYSYGGVGTGVVTTDNIYGVTTYELYALLETPGHPQSVAFQKPKWNFNKSVFPGSYNPQLYESEMR